MPSPSGHHGTDSACVRFLLGQRGFAIPLSQVREIATAERVSSVPLAPSVVRGIVPLRGHVVTLLDAAVIFDLPHPPARCPEDRLMVIFSEPYKHLGLYVHAPVEISRAHLDRNAPVAAVQPMVMVAAAGGRPGAGALQPSSGDSTDGGAASGILVHLVTASELVAFCDARVLEGFRRKV